MLAFLAYFVIRRYDDHFMREFVTCLDIFLLQCLNINYIAPYPSLTVQFKKKTIFADGSFSKLVRSAIYYGFKFPAMSENNFSGRSLIMNLEFQQLLQMFNQITVYQWGKHIEPISDIMQ